MTGKQKKTIKHIPQRTCVGCRTILPKRMLIRVVRFSGGVRVDLTGKLAGRGAYLHNRQSCWERGLNGALSHALKISLTPDDTQALRQFMQTMPKEDETGEE